MSSRFRNWCFTSFKEPQIDTDNINYYIYQKELCPTTQKEHWQGYIECTKALTLGQIKKVFDDNTLHLERRIGSQGQAIEYCKKLESKVGDSIEWGFPKEQGKRTDLIYAKEEVLKGTDMLEILNTRPSLIRYINQLQKYKALTNNTPRKWETEVTVLIGEPGSGKTRYVHDREEDLYTLIEPTSTVWFDGYEGQEAVLIDDFKGHIRYNLLLQLLDRYPMRVNTKGGTTNWCPKRVYITSNYPVNEWYKDTKALKRRIKKTIRCCTNVGWTEVAGNTDGDEEDDLEKKFMAIKLDV